jgi:predicted nuclease with TOPRIM domain
MAKEFYSLDYTHQQVDDLLKYVDALKGEEHVTLTKDEYIKVLEALKFIAEFNGDYEKLTNKPSIPTNLSQFNNDMGYTKVNLESIQDWVEALIDEAELGNEEYFTSYDFVNNMFNDMHERIISELNRFKDYSEAAFLKKEDFVIEESGLIQHTHLQSEITSVLKDATLYTLEDDIIGLNKDVEYSKNKVKEYNEKIVSMNHKIDELKTRFNALCQTIKKIDSIDTKLNNKADKDHTHNLEDFSFLENTQHEHHNKIVLDTLDEGVLNKWNRTSSFVGNVQEATLDGSRGDVLEKWASQNSKTTTIEVGGIPEGSNLEGKTLYQILNMMLYPTDMQSIEITMNPARNVFEVGKDSSVTIKSLTAKVTVGGNPIRNVKLFIDDKLKTTKTTDVENGGTFVFDINETFFAEDTLNIEFRYKIRVEDSTGIVREKYAPSIHFYYPLYYGVLGSDITIDTVTVDDIISKFKLVSGKGNKTFPYTVNNQRMFFAYPKKYGLLRSIADTNGFEIIKSFDYKEISITINGTEYDYYVYINNANKNTNFNITYKF